MQTREINSSPFKIVDMVDDTNLRTVSWNQIFLEHTRTEYKLRHRDAVLFVNVARDRFRLVVNYFGLACLILPPIDNADRLSIYLKVAKFLKAFWLRDPVSTNIDAEITRLETVIKDQQKLVKKTRTKKAKG